MMSEFGCMEDDWDLQAVVRGSCISSSSSEAFADIMENHPPTPSLFAPPFSCFGHQDEILMMNFPAYDDDFFEIRTPEFGDGLEGLYKPFYPTTTTTPTSISAPDDDHQEVKKEPENETKILHPSNSADDESKRTSPKSCTTSVDATTTQTPKSKRGRKNQHKRVVHQVAADGLSNDMWAWRKYGQKPIKGSPYPRSYYRCSSLKGCLARKQVERSSSDPSIFIITYTSEHSHAHPTRRSALAGSTRTKSPLPKQPGAASAATANGPKVPTVKDTLPSPKTPSMASLEDEVLQQVSIGNDQEVEQISESSQSGNTNNNVMVPDLIFPEELFPSFEDFQGLLFDQLLDNFAAY